jgi:uncharacterized protein YndB with AHSA1/START domain
MPTNAHIAASADIPAAPARVWHVLTDYRVHHPAILPKDIFRGLEVLEGGVGAGTRFRLTMRMGGKDQVTDISVSEPEPGRLLVEGADDGSVVTRFILKPIDEGRGTSVTFDTDYTLPGGPLLPILRWVTNRILGGLYRRELENLKKYLAEDRDLMG